MNDMTPVKATTPKDWETDQEVRWCPGCGDYAILKAVQRTMPEIGGTPENTVFISGIGCSSRFADNLADLQFFAQFPHAAQSTIAPEYVADGFGFPFIHNELAVLNIQPQRRQAAHPHALLFGSSNLVADTLARDLPFKLRKGQEHIEGQPAHAGCRVEGLGDGDE